ncbi:hypothetical protein F4814DRAFT_451156 [Daldinia grandis]|nr:hypothetical protein F4814DRAFT_451156 [Daldinia grandis]
MPTRRKRDIIKDFFKTSKPRPLEIQNAGNASPDPTTHKRKASTSAPSSPISIRPKKKRIALTLFSPKPASTNVPNPTSTGPRPPSSPPNSFVPPSLFPKEPAVLPTDPPLFGQTSDDDIKFSLGSSSDRSVSVSSQSTNSLASHQSSGRASKARPRDIVDARRVLRRIEQVKGKNYKVKKGGPGGKYLVALTLHYQGYKKLQEILAEPENHELSEWVKRYLRRGDKQFVIHMPSTFHESMAGNFNSIIDRWLGSVESGALCTVDGTRAETVKVASRLKPTLAVRVKCKEPRDDRLEPDLSFTYRECTVADLVVEVAWSQSHLKLPDRARRYIEGNNGEIRTVIGLNMNDIYKGGRRATVSVWKAKLVGDKWTRTTAVNNKEFINEYGDPLEDYVLRLTLKDFICEEEQRALEPLEDVPLEISSEILHGLYKEAFRKHVMEKSEEEMKEITTKVNNIFMMVSRAEEIILKHGVEDLTKSKVMGKKELKKVKSMISQVNSNYEKIEMMMKGVNEEMDLVDDKIAKVEKMRVKLEKQIGVLELKIAELKTEEGKLVEAEEELLEERIGGVEMGEETGEDDIVEVELTRIEDIDAGYKGS